MDYRALAELVWLSFAGLAALAVAVGFTVRAFLAPVVREVLAGRRTESDREQQRLDVRLERVEDRLADIETHLHRLAAVEEFRRELERPDAREGESEGPA